MFVISIPVTFFFSVPLGGGYPDKDIANLDINSGPSTEWVAGSSFLFHFLLPHLLFPRVSFSAPSPPPPPLHRQQFSFSFPPSPSALSPSLFLCPLLPPPPPHTHFLSLLLSRPYSSISFFVSLHCGNMSYVVIERWALTFVITEFHIFNFWWNILVRES